MEAIKKKNISGGTPIETSIRHRTRQVRHCTDLTLDAPAKINLSLVIQDKRPDGFHDVHTVMAAVSLKDRLNFRSVNSPGILLHCTGRAIDSGVDNLVYRAAALLAQKGGIEPAVEIHLEKNIPIGAGLGGGSSDAATTLQGLNLLWGLGYSIEDMYPLAAQLGSDVAFFLQESVAICTGRGEIVQPIPHTPMQSVMLIISDLVVSTRDVYHHYHYQSLQNKDLMRRIRYYLRKGDMDGLLCQGINNLAETCYSRCPSLVQLRHRIEQMGIGPVHLSGSGSCMFVSSSDIEKLRHGADQIRSERLADVQIVNFLNSNDAFVEVHHANL